MAETTEVIHQQMEETRTRLAENLDKLSKQTLETVGEVASTVGEVASSVTATVESVQETVEAVEKKVADTVGTVQEKVEETVDVVSETVQETVVGVKEFFNIAAHVDRNPWLTVGGCVVLGFLAERLLTPVTRTAAEGPATRDQPRRGNQPGDEPADRLADYWPAMDSSQQSEPSWLENLFSAFAPAAEKLKGLAISTALGLARDALTKPLAGELGAQLRGIFDEVTTRLGGQPIRQDELDSNQGTPSPQKGDSNGKRHEAKMDRPLGAGPR